MENPITVEPLYPADAIASAITRGLDFLANRQLENGEFNCFWLTHPTIPERRTLDSSIFPTALIAHSLSFSDAPNAQAITKRAGSFLVDEMERCGVWRHWTRSHPYVKFIPPDADDTAYSAIVLRSLGVEFPDSRELLRANCDRRGRIYTWIIPRVPPPLSIPFWKVALRLNPVRLVAFFKMYSAARNDVDGVVNANALYYLGQSERTRPIIEFLQQIILERREAYCDKWYLSPHNFYYALSRNYRADPQFLQDVRETVVQRITDDAASDGNFGSHVVDTALAVCSLLNFASRAAELHAGISAILSAQQPDGEWPLHPVYYGGADCNTLEKYSCWGSAELSTGLCLEALIRYHQQYY